MYNTKEIEWVNDEAKEVWNANKEICLECGKEWSQIILGAQDFAVNVQKMLREGAETFNAIVDDAFNSIIEKYELCRAQLFEVISILTHVWTYGERLRIWNNIREGADSNFSGLYFSC